MSEEYRFVVNGVEHVTTQNKPLLRYLRDDLNLTSVKDGCSEGACGTCTVMVDGMPVKSCVLSTKLTQGRTVTTVEGLTDAEKEAFVYAFGAVGAVQCGFCIPGIIMSAVEMLNTGKTYTRDEIRKQLSGHLCRCTGYQNIVTAVEKAIDLVNGAVGQKDEAAPKA